MRHLWIACAGAAAGMAMIWFGFSFRIGGPEPLVLLQGSSALLPAALAGTLLAVFIDFAVRKWT